jgi:uncharacterized protein YqfA (UPF0365 family)
VSGARVSFPDLIGMSLRKFNTTLIVNSRIQAVGAGLEIPLREMQTHYQAGGDLMRVINAMIAANKANIDCRGRPRPRSTWPAAIFSTPCRHR